MSGRILILTGPPGSGKTTAADVLAGRRPRSVHLEADSFFRFVRSGYVEPWRPESHEQNRVVMGAVADAAARYAGAGYDTVVEGIVLPRWFLAPLRDRLRGSGLSADYAVLRAPLELCVARAAQRSAGPLADAAAAERVWRSFEDLDEYEGHAIDVDGLSVTEVADAVDARLRDGGLALS